MKTLVINFFDNTNTRIASVYLRNGAHTPMGLFILKDYIEVLDRKNIFTALGIIRAAETLGGVISGGVNSLEFKHVSALYTNEHFRPFAKTMYSPLVAISNLEMDRFDSYADKFINVYQSGWKVKTDMLASPTEFDLDDLNKVLHYLVGMEKYGMDHQVIDGIEYRIEED